MTSIKLLPFQKHIFYLSTLLMCTFKFQCRRIDFMAFRFSWNAFVLPCNWLNRDHNSNQRNTILAVVNSVHLKTTLESTIYIDNITKTFQIQTTREPAVSASVSISCPKTIWLVGFYFHEIQGIFYTLAWFKKYFFLTCSVKSSGCIRNVLRLYMIFINVPRVPRGSFLTTYCECHQMLFGP